MKFIGLVRMIIYHSLQIFKAADNIIF